MQFSNSNMISVEEVLSDVLRNVDDEAMQKFSKGYYVSLIRRSLEKLAVQLYHKKEIIYFDYSDVLEIPKNCFNVREIYLFNGDCCDITNAQNVWWKRDYKGNSANRVTKDTNDHFIKSYSYSDNVYYYNEDAGRIYLSSACATFSRVMVVFNSTGTSEGNALVVPMRLRNVLIDLVTLECFKKLKARLGNPKEAQIYRQLYNDTYMNLYDKVSGSWWDALSFVNSMDTHSRQSLYEYISKANS